MKKYLLLLILISHVNAFSKETRILDCKLGDANSDGLVTKADADTILQYIVGLKVKIDLKAANINGDDRVTSSDATRVLQLLERPLTEAGIVNILTNLQCRVVETKFVY